MATWAVKAQARTVLGIELTDQDVLNVPLLATDQYGHFLPGANGFPQIVTPGAPAWLEGNPAPTAARCADRRRTPSAPGTPSSTTSPTTRCRSATTTATRRRRRPLDAGRRRRHRPTTAAPATYDDEMLDAHFVAGDGRVNENIGLTAVHHIFHSEHNRLRGRASTGMHQRRPRHRGPGRASPTGRPSARRAGLRRAAVPGRPVRHRDGVPAPGVRGVRPQGAADGQPLREGHRLRHRASTRRSAPSSPTPSTASGTRCSPRPWTARTADGDDRTTSTCSTPSSTRRRSTTAAVRPRRRRPATSCAA